MNKQKGGERLVPLYYEKKNDPFIPHQEKDLKMERQAENKQYSQSIPAQIGEPYQQQQQQSQQSQQRGQNPLVNLQVYQPQKPKEQKMPQPHVFLPPTVPGPFYPPQYHGIQAPLMNYQQIPIIRQYNISMDGVMGNHEQMSMIYEDMLPQKQFATTSNTVGDRLNIYNYLRSMMFSKGDGHDVGLSSKSKNSLLRQLKFMEVNPYNTCKFSHNPYMGLPRDFLIYRSCYPIRHESASATVSCAKNSIGMNIRIYKMIQGSYLINAQDTDKMKDYEEWRELSYYEYVREYILKKKEVPNFIFLYGYNIATSCNIDFDAIAKLGNNMTPEKYRQAIVNKKPELPKLTARYAVDHIFNPVNKLLPQSRITNPELDLTKYLGKALVAMTEAPHYNLLGWASKTYQVDGNIKRQISTGFHLAKVWYSILFQIMAAIYALKIHKIYFSDFSVSNNVFIKDLHVAGVATKYWKYKINGIDYYVPNYGYVVLLDSSFSGDACNTTNILSKINRGVGVADKHKIYAKFLDNNIPDVKFDEETFGHFRKALDTNVYGQEFVSSDGCPPPQEVRDLLNNINGFGSKNIGEYFPKFMTRFVNNRIGTLLRENEIQNRRDILHNELKKGDIIVHQDMHGGYKFGLYLKDNLNGTAHILTKNMHGPNPPQDTIQVQKATLFGYSISEPVQQYFKPNEALLNEDELLETYILSEG